MNNNNIYFSCFSLIRACVSSLFDNFFKVVAVCLIVCFVLISPAAAFASTTESYIKFASTRAIPSGYKLPLDSLFYDKNSKTYTNPTTHNLLDDQSSFSAQWLPLNGYSGDHLIGFRLSFAPSISGSFYSQHTIDFSTFKFYFDNPNLSDAFYLSSTAVPAVCYARYTGVYDYQIYDGSAGYDRWVYDNSFVLDKPISFSFVNPRYLDTGGFGGQISISSPSISSSDLLDVTAYRNQVLGATQIVDKSLEDYSYQNMRISVDNVQCYVMFDINDNNFISYRSQTNTSIPDSLDGFTLVTILEPNPSTGNLTSVNVRSVDYLDDTNASLLFISNGFKSLIDNFSSGLSNVVTNATDNANRIIQNTTQKVDEVKQGVSDVKNSVVETKNSILDLPNKIKDMLLGLIIPSDEDIAGKYDEFSSLLEAKLGVIYQIPAMILELFQTLLSGVTDPQTTLTFPSLSLPWIDGTQMKLWDSIEFEIIPTGMDVLKELIQTVTSMVCVIMTFNSVKRIYENFLRGR